MEASERTMGDLIDRIDMAEIDRAKFKLMAQRCEALIDSVASLFFLIHSRVYRWSNKASDRGASMNVYAGGKKSAQEQTLQQ